MFRLPAAGCKSRNIVEPIWYIIGEDFVITGGSDEFQMEGTSCKGCCKARCAASAGCAGAGLVPACAPGGEKEPAFTTGCRALVGMGPTDPQVRAAQVCSTDI